MCFICDVARFTSQELRIFLFIPYSRMDMYELLPGISRRKKSRKAIRRSRHVSVERCFPPPLPIGLLVLTFGDILFAHGDVLASYVGDATSKRHSMRCLL